MKQNITVFFALCSLFAAAQVQHRLIPYKDSSVYTFNKEQYDKSLQSLHDQYDPMFTNKADLRDYITITQDDYENMIADGKLYDNWNDATEYLQQLMKNLLRDQWKEGMQVKILKDASVNAFMTGHGIIFVNAGLLAQVNTEAELVSVLGRCACIRRLTSS